MNPTEPTKTNTQLTEDTTLKSIDSTQSVGQITNSSVDQISSTSQASNTPVSTATTSQEKKAPVLNKGVIIGLVVFVVLLVAGGIYWFYTMQ